MSDTTLYAFNNADSQALLGMIGQKAQGGSMLSDAVSTADIILAVATSAITARAGTTLGVGTASAKQISDARVLSNLFGSDIEVLNPGSAIANGASLICFRVGNRWIGVEIC
jgi:hypothetical protein